MTKLSEMLAGANPHVIKLIDQSKLDAMVTEIIAYFDPLFIKFKANPVEMLYFIYALTDQTMDIGETMLSLLKTLDLLKMENRFGCDEKKKTETKA